jgi:hypothetical protein
MERTFIYSASGKDAMTGEHVMEQILEETFDNLVSLGCKYEREIVLKGQNVYVYKTVYIDVIEHDDEPIDLDIDDYVDIPGLGRVPNEVAPEGYVYILGKRTKVMEAESEKLTWKKLLSLTSDETQNAFLSFINSESDRKRHLAMEIDPNRINYQLSAWFASNGRLSKDHMSELVSAAKVLGLTIDSGMTEMFDRYVNMVRYNTDIEQMKALRAARK